MDQSTEINWATLHKDATTVLQGEFPVEVVQADATESSTGKPMIKCKLKITSGTYANRVLYNNFTISAESPAAMKMFFSHMAIFGLDSRFFTANQSAPTSVIAAALVGRRAVAEVGVREWKGVEQEDIKSWKVAVGGPGAGTPGPVGRLGGVVAHSTQSSGPVEAAPLGQQPSSQPPAPPF